MPVPDPIERFLAEVDRQLPLPPTDRRRVVAELRAHVEDAIADELGRGASQEEAVRRSLARVGDARSIALAYANRPLVLDGLAALGALACATVAAWLFIVATTILPAVDPDRVGFWLLVAVGFLGLSGLTVMYLWRGQRSRAGGPGIVVVALVAIAVGARFAIPMLTTSGDFEGYILLMGLVLMGQGGVVIADVIARRRRPRVGPVG